MGIRKKVLLSIGLVSLTLTAIFYYLFKNVILNNFDTIEERFVHDNISRVKATIEDQAKSLDTITHDWASWDDTYGFIVDRNKEYEETNIVEDTFLSSAKINYLLYFDTEGKLVHGTFYDPEQKALVPVPANLLSQLAGNKQLFHHPTNDSHFTGLIMISDAILLISARPILKSDGEGPNRGTLVMMRILDEARIMTIKEITKMDFSVHIINTPLPHTDSFEILDTILANPDNFIIKPLDNDYIAGYGAMKDIFSQPLLLLRLTVPRTIHIQGHRTLAYLLWTTIITSLTFSLLVFIILDRLVLNRLAVLNSDVLKISKSAHPAYRVQVSGSDEFASLSTSINTMLDAIDKNQLEQKEKEVRLRTIAEFTRSGLFITQGPKLIYVNSVMELITGYTSEELFSMNWWDIFHPDYRGYLRSKIMETQKVGSPPEQYEVMIIRKTGEEGWLDLRIKHVTFQGNPASFGVCTDL
ncbi:MAG: PAS domain S-box protein [Proteobacteria bacterium]|nr:PAS domain S-box protein [Pseudomonadota bacterium]MBU0968413.1 PAS domain S-box protein [Pseudomonadota bacterium]